jgi:hypothetical protein
MTIAALTARIAAAGDQTGGHSADPGPGVQARLSHEAEITLGPLGTATSLIRSQIGPY